MKKLNSKSSKRIVTTLLISLIFISLLLMRNTFIKEGKENRKLYYSTYQEDTDKPKIEDPSLLHPEDEIKSIPDAVIPDYQAWLSIPGTSIDYPVVQAYDQTFYLNHDVYQNESPYGSIFIDSECNINAPVVTIHGHHMMNENKMFTPLLNYRDEDFMMNHTSLSFNDHEYEVIGGMEVDTNQINEKIYMYYLNDYDSYHRTLKIEELFSSDGKDVDVQEDDRFILLSTCINYDGDRWVVLARQTNN